ncbi:hypothetical protein [Mesorhizobium sp. WSM3860]|uniref:hypothetical protein n=1 Tax=Mesorhizobium sp. WSM3860 TaxID=2029403 RepID=UPI001596A9D6|nr:hypothetical protein [Mesorhizobium sp. WSM3860]
MILSEIDFDYRLKQERPEQDAQASAAFFRAEEALAFILRRRRRLAKLEVLSWRRR